MSDEIKIMAEPMSVPSMCRFTVDRPVFPNESYFFGSAEAAENSPLAVRLFQIDGVSAVLVSHNQITVTKRLHEPWQVIGKQVGAAIRAHLASGEPAVRPDVLDELPSEEILKLRVAEVIETEVMPAVRMHGGLIRLLDVKRNTVFLQMGGGCQGCSSAESTLKQGVELAIRRAVPEIGDILDTTDHAAGRNPYYTARH